MKEIAGSEERRLYLAFLRIFKVTVSKADNILFVEEQIEYFNEQYRYLRDIEVNNEYEWIYNLYKHYKNKHPHIFRNLTNLSDE